MASNWPITSDDLRRALEYADGQGDEDDLDLYARAACDLIDVRTGRDEVDPTAHEIGGALPAVFPLSARETAKLWWQQSFNGPRGGPVDPSQAGPPMGASLPRKVEGWLELYLAAPKVR